MQRVADVEAGCRLVSALQAVHNAGRAGSFVTLLPARLTVATSTSEPCGVKGSQPSSMMLKYSQPWGLSFQRRPEFRQYQ